MTAIEINDVEFIALPPIDEFIQKCQVLELGSMRKLKLA